MKHYRLFALGLSLALPAWSVAQNAAQPVAPELPAQTPPPAAEEKAQGTKAEQLVAAQKQLGILKLRHDEKHPAVLKQRAKVARLQQELRAEEKQKGPPTRAQELAAAKEELEESLKKFTEEHPHVKSLRKRIAELERQTS